MESFVERYKKLHLDIKSSIIVAMIPLAVDLPFMNGEGIDIEEYELEIDNVPPIKWISVMDDRVVVFDGSGYQYNYERIDLYDLVEFLDKLRKHANLRVEQLCGKHV